MADLTKYQSLITSEHRKPKMLAWVGALTQPFLDIQAQNAALPSLFDPDLAVGEQEDMVGLWVGASRALQVPLTNVFFSWGVPGQGWGQGIWLGPYDSGTTLYLLPDELFRTLIRAVIAKNHWDGSIPGAYAVLSIVFGPAGYTILIRDGQDMSMSYIIIGPPLSAVMRGLLVNGQLTLKPAGVRIAGYFTPSVPGQPIFGWGVQNSLIAGWGTGCWLEPA